MLFFFSSFSLFYDTRVEQSRDFSARKHADMISHGRDGGFFLFLLAGFFIFNLIAL